MASSGNDNAASKAAGVVKEHLGGSGNGDNPIAKAVGKENADKIEESSGFVSTGDAKETVAKATEGSQK